MFGKMFVPSTKFVFDVCMVGAAGLLHEVGSTSSQLIDPNSMLDSKEMPKHHREQHPKQQLQRAKCGIKFPSDEK